VHALAGARVASVCCANVVVVAVFRIENAALNGVAVLGRACVEVLAVDICVNALTRGPARIDRTDIVVVARLGSETVATAVGRNIGLARAGQTLVRERNLDTTSGERQQQQQADAGLSIEVPEGH